MEKEDLNKLRKILDYIEKESLKGRLEEIDRFSLQEALEDLEKKYSEEELLEALDEIEKALAEKRYPDMEEKETITCFDCSYAKGHGSVWYCVLDKRGRIITPADVSLAENCPHFKKT